MHWYIFVAFLLLCIVGLICAGVYCWRKDMTVLSAREEGRREASTDSAPVSAPPHVGSICLSQVGPQSSSSMTTSPDSSPLNVDSSPDVGRISTGTPFQRRRKIDLPRFWVGNPTMYFFTIELLFEESEIASERAKYLSLVSILAQDEQINQKIAHFLHVADLTTPYSSLKQMLLTHFSSDDNNELETSLGSCIRGNDTVKDYLVRLRGIFTSRYGETTALQKDLLKSRILQSVDAATRLALYHYEQCSVEDIAAHADRLLARAKSDSASFSPGNNFSTPPPNHFLNQRAINEMLESRLNHLDRTLNRLEPSLKASGEPSPSRSSQTPFSPQTPAKSDVERQHNCWYHAKFGTRAKFCEGSPCPLASPNLPVRLQKNDRLSSMN